MTASARLAFAALMLIAVLAACGGDDDGAPEAMTLERGAPMALVPGEYTHEHSADFEGRMLWETRAVEDIAERELIVVAYSGDRSGIGGGSIVYLVDRDTGEIAGELEAGPDLLVEYYPGDRDGGGEGPGNRRLVVSDMRLAPPPDGSAGGGGFAPWYWVMSFNVDEGMALELEVPLGPERWQPRSSPYQLTEQGQLTLARDGGTAYVLMSAREEEDVAGVAVIDLEATGTGEVLTTVPYPARDEGRPCGQLTPAVYPHGDSAAMVTCSAVGFVRVIDPDGSVREDTDINGMGYVFGYPEWGDRIASVATAVETTGGLGLVHHEGTYATAEGGIVDGGRALPEGATLLPGWAGRVYALDETRLVLPYRTREDAAGPYPPFSAPQASGFVVFDLETQRIKMNVAVPHRGSFALSTGAIAVVEEGRVDVIDAETGEVTHSFEGLTLDDMLGEAAADAPPGRVVVPRVR